MCCQKYSVSSLSCLEGILLKEREKQVKFCADAKTWNEIFVPRYKTSKFPNDERGKNNGQNDRSALRTR